MITMSFRVDVRLLKLALYSAEGEWINIGFTYDPGRMNNNFVLPIPGDLPPSAYYIAQWSVTDDRRGLVNGEFRFAFGPGRFLLPRPLNWNLRERWALPETVPIAKKVSSLTPASHLLNEGTASQPAYSTGVI